MTETLQIKNTGPIKEANLTLKKVNLFIGKNGTGKSITGKILQISRYKELGLSLKKGYVLDNYIDENSVIKYESDVKHNKNQLNEKVIKSLLNLENKDDKQLVEIIKNLALKEMELQSSYYIPAERNIVPFLSSYGVNFFSAKIPLPDYILEFASNFRLAKDEVKEADIFEYKYKFENDEDRIYMDKDNYIFLNESSSGVQALLPLKLTIPYLNKEIKKDYILEEPELNLFPKEQFELVKFMVENSNSILFISHSPYILVALNILLFAYQVGNINEQTKKLVSKFIPQKFWINPDEFSGYCFDNGGVIDIARNGLISDNYLDDVNDELNNLFDELLEIKVMNEK